tara:strand:- start:275 stop:1723 length:1449 start_codon:yes stop_codon:yes gene_type:complete
MLLPNFNAIKHMTDPEQQKTMFLELEKQAVDILRKRDFPLSAELQAFQTRANTLTANADNPEKSKFYRANDLEIMKGFSNKFAIIAGMPDGEQKTKMLDELKNSMNSITTANPELIEKENLIQSQSTIKLSQEELTKKAIASLGIENADIQMINNELHIVVPPKNPGDLPNYVALARLNSVGEQVAGNPKVFDAAVKGMNASLDHIAGIADLKAALEKHPDAFNVIGKLYMTATDFADFIRKPEVAEFFGGAEIQKTVAKRIEFVKTVKDQIFDDPRLSDQDLRLIIQYIAVLNDPFIGTSRAFAALNSLEQVMVNSIAKNMFIAKPGLKVTNGRGANGEYLDAYDMDSIGGRTFRALFKRAHPEFTLPNSKEEFLKMPKDQQKFFATRGAIYAIQAENAVGSVNSLATYILKAGGDVNKGLEQHNKNYAYNTTNRGTFNPKNIIAGSGKNRDKLITDLIGTMEPEQVEKLKARLGDNFGIG